MRYYIKIYGTAWNGGDPIPTTLKHKDYYTLEEMVAIFGMDEEWVLDKGTGKIYDGEFIDSDWLKIVALPEYVQVMQ
jgi:hypothetical protein